MKILLILVFLTIAASAMAYTKKQFNVTKVIQNVGDKNVVYRKKTPEQRRSLNLFPKKTMRFTITDKPLTKKTTTKSQPKSSEEDITRKPIRAMKPFANTFAKPTIKNTENVKKVATNSFKPNFKKATVKPTVVEERSNENDEQTTDFVEPSSEVDRVDKLYKRSNKRINDLNSIEEETSTGRVVLADLSTNFGYLDPIDEDRFELEDKNEYIFIREKRSRVKRDVVDDLDDFINSEETKDYRSKRSVIEEENMGSTVAGFKFTGSDNKPIHSLNYKNINH